MILATTQEPNSQPAANALAPAPLSLWQRISSRLFRSSTLGLIDQALVSGTRFLLTVLIGRFCGQGELGIYTLGFSLIVSWVSIKYSVISLPYTVYAGRDNAEQQRYAGSTLAHLGILLVATVIGLLGASILFAAGLSGLEHMREYAPMFATLTIVMPAILIWEFTRRYMFANLRLRTVLRIDATLAACLILGAAAVYLAGQLSAVTALGVMGGGCLIATLPWLFMARNEFKVSWPSVRSDWRMNWSFGKWIFASQLSWSAMSSTVPWILAILYGKEEAGAYGACMTLSLLSNPVIIGFGNTLLPTMANAHHQSGRQEVRRIALVASAGVGLVMTLFCIGVAFFGGDFLVIVLSEDYTGLDLPVLMLAIAMLIQTLSIGPDIGTQVLERPDLSFRANLLGLIAILAVCYPLVSQWGVLGGTLAWLIGNVVSSATRWICFLMIGTDVPLLTPNAEEATTA